jgi:hypothetical protein
MHFGRPPRYVKEFTESEWPGSKPEFDDSTGRLVEPGNDDASSVLLCSHGIAVQMRRHSGVFGLVEAGEIELRPDRSMAAPESENYSSALRELMRGLLPKIQQEVDRLEQYGSIPSRHSFLRSLSLTYGIQILDNSPLRWIPTLEQPGNLVHKSRMELKRQLESESCLVLCEGISLIGHTNWRPGRSMTANSAERS